MTQQDIVDAVNHLTVNYNLSWQDIKYDADKAILKINAYVGAMFPKMSEVLTGPQTTYSIQHKGQTIPIFPEQYIHSVVIPFIASEVLARDEEFTTVYNKYLLEVEDGLFLMVSNEYNRIHPMFLQHDTTGVFFSEETQDNHYVYSSNGKYPTSYVSEAHAQSPEPLEITFSVIYLINNKDIVCDDTFIIDENKYKYGDQYKIKGLTQKYYYNASGTKRYELIGWYTDTLCVNEAQDGVIHHDVYIYAKWDEESTLEYSYADRYGKAKLLFDVTYLNLPRFVNGRELTKIDDDLLRLHNHVETLIISDTVQKVYLTNFKGSELIFPKTGHIEVQALDLSQSKLETDENINRPLIIPRSVYKISSGCFGAAVASSVSADAVDRRIDIICLRKGPDTDNFTLPEGLFYIEYMSDHFIEYNVHYVGDR